MAYWDSELQRVRSPILRYGFAVVSVVVATAIALAIQESQFRDVELPLLVLVIGLVTWYAGTGPAVVAVLLATAVFSYFFVEPIYSFYVSARDLPYFLIFVLSASIVASFSAVRRRIEDNLRHARDRLEIELEQRQQRDAEIRKLNLGNLIDDLLAFSRIGRAKSRTTEVDLQQLVNEVVAEIRQQAKGQEISWKFGALPVCYGDRALLRVVLVNLLSNAVKFSGTRRPAEVEIGSVDGHGDKSEIFVRDNGVGFDMRYVDKLFGVFQRLHRADEFEGTGIGLATVQRIVHRHCGTVRAEGTVDQGATFYFSLPTVQHLVEGTVSVP